MKNQGEIISLIVFVVLTLALGVTTYFGFKGLGEQKAELATAQSECQNVQNENYTLSNELAAVKHHGNLVLFANSLCGFLAEVGTRLGIEFECFHSVNCLCYSKLSSLMLP